MVYGGQLHESEPLRYVEWWYMGRRACHSLRRYISEAEQPTSTVDRQGTTMKQALLGDFQLKLNRLRGVMIENCKVILLWVTQWLFLGARYSFDGIDYWINLIQRRKGIALFDDCHQYVSLLQIALCCRSKNHQAFKIQTFKIQILLLQH